MITYCELSINGSEVRYSIRNATRMKNKIVEATSLTKVYNKKVTAVDHVSFSVDEGELFGFIGPNGAGKTTTIKMLTTLASITEGKATVAGYDVSKDPADVRKVIGIVPQELTADDELSGIENLLLSAKLHRVPGEVARKKAYDLLELLGLESAEERHVKTYSGGMRRRLQLAMGLIHDPKILILDEPTLGLDIQTRQVMWTHIRELNRNSRITVFMTTHYLEEADSTCDRIAIIDHGRILKVGSPSELKASLGGDIIQIGVEENGNDLSQLISQVNHVKTVTKFDSSYRVKAELGEEVAPAIIEVLRNNGYHVSRLSLTKPSMDEVYLEYTGRSLREEQADEERMFALRRTMRRARA